MWSKRGLVTHWVLFVIDLATRRVEIACTTTNPNRTLMKQMAKNLTDAFDGVLVGKQFLIMDRDTNYTDEFRAILNAEGIQPILCPVRAPSANAFAERFVLSIKSECLNRMILFGRGQLERAIAEYLEHYHRERNHQSIGNRLLSPMHDAEAQGAVVGRKRLGGMLRFYYRKVA